MTIAGWIYLVDILTSLNGFLFTMFILSIISICIFAILSPFFYVDEELREPINKAWKWIGRKTYWMVLVVGLLVFIPSKSSMYLMLGSHYLKDSTVPAKVYEALNLKLDSVINDMRSKGNEKSD